MNCLSISYKNTGIKLRERLAFSEPERLRIAGQVIGSKSATQCVILVTADRTELYYVPTSENSENQILTILADHAQVPVDIVADHVSFTSDDDALIHLFRVCAGLESMIIGEAEVLGQVKYAYLTAKNDGTVFEDLNLIFQAAFNAATRISEETTLTKSSTSVARLASREIADFAENVNVLVIGASGKNASDIFVSLAKRPNVKVYATLKDDNEAIELEKRYNIETIKFAEKCKYLDDMDCVISTTVSNNEYMVTVSDIEFNVKTEKPRLFVDLAVPQDIDPAVATLPNSKIINLDYFKQVAEESNNIEQEVIDKANEIIFKEIDILKKDFIFNEFIPSMKKVRSGLNKKTADDLVNRMKNDFDSENFKKFILVLRSIVD